MNPTVARAFENHPPLLAKRLRALRQLILDTAAATPGVGVLEETLKWNEPAYLTTRTKSGSTIRIGRKPDSATTYALYFNCNTSLVDTFRTLFPDTFVFEGKRAIRFDISGQLPKKELRICIAMALTYHLDKKKSKARDELSALRNIGKAMRKDFDLLGIASVRQLAKCDADELYARIQQLTHSRHDPCVWDTYAAAIHQARTGQALPWWEFTKVRKGIAAPSVVARQPQIKKKPDRSSARRRPANVRP